MDWKDKKVLVVGSGISGIGAVKLLSGAGAEVILYEGNKSRTKEEIEAGLPEGTTAVIAIGRPLEEVGTGVTLVVPSPGVPLDTPFMLEVKKAGIPIWGEIELAYAFAKGRLAAITGTNGKTTTTTLVGEILKKYYELVFVVGNIGYPYTEAALFTTNDAVTVAEISSFQLETTVSFAPQVSAILNITPDHLDRHHTMEAYAAAKERIAGGQNSGQICVLNYDNPYTREYARRCPARVVFFSSGQELSEGFYLSGDEICMADAHGAKRLLGISELHLVGMCNVENVMAAMAVSLHMGVPLPVILETVRQFKAVEHRIEFVATKGGVDYYNDSKGTNPDAAIQGIKAMTRQTVLLAGGYDKKSEYDEWVEAFDGKVKALVLIGQTADQIEACARRHGITHILRADTYEEALVLCTKEAKEGDAVLLSPACASWGMFPNYEVRGQVFKDYVLGLEE